MKVLINGIEYMALSSGFLISEQMGNKTATDISVRVDSQPFPTAGDVIEVFDNNEKRIFFGTCGIPQSPPYSTGLEAKIYQITCNNANSILSQRIINVAYQDTTISEIVRSLFDQYIAEEGIALGGISDVDVTMEVYTAADYNLQDALNELADLVTATWKVDNDKKFWFVVEKDFPQFPRTITKNFLLGTELQHTTKDYYTRTVQYVTGATDVTTKQTETYTYDGEQSSFTTSFPLAEKPSIIVNGTTVPPSRIGVNGIDDDNSDIIFAFAYNSQTIAVKDKEYLKQGDSVTVEYVGMFPIRVVAYNNDKIAEISKLTGTSGKREQVYLATDITTTKDALQLAQSLLTQFSVAKGEVSLWLLSSQLKMLGMTMDDVDIFTQVTFNLPNLGIMGKFVITERSLEMVSPTAEDYKITLKMSDRNYLKSYGETISALYRDISQLYVRQDDIVISQPYFSEETEMTEEMVAGISFPNHCTQSVVNGSLMAGFTFDGMYYPTSGAPGYSGNIESDEPFYLSPEMTEGSPVLPINLDAEIYPV